MGVYQRCRFQPGDAVALARFLDEVRQCHWSLSSLGFPRRPEVVPLVSPARLVEEDKGPRRLGTFLLKRAGRIIAMLQVDDQYGDGKVAAVSGVETHPEFQRRGIFWRHLGEPCLRVFCRSGFEHLEALTRAFDHRDIPLYKRAGFRVVPGPSLRMENYLPLILKHPATRSFFARHDFVRALQNQRSYGYDGVGQRGLELFAYEWISGGEQLRVLVDWGRRQLVSIQRPDWAVWCFPVPLGPAAVHCELENRGGLPLAFCVQVPGGYRGCLEFLAPGQTWAQEVLLAGEWSRPGVRVEFEVAGECVPFVLRPRPEARGVAYL